MAQRKSGWFASCGVHRVDRAGKLEQQNAGRTRNLRVLFFLSFCRSHAVSGPDERRHRKAGRCQKPVKNRRQNYEKSPQEAIGEGPGGTKIEPKSMKNRSWEARGAADRSGHARGHARDAPSAPQRHPKNALGTPRAAPRAPGSSPGPSRGAPGTLLGRLGRVFLRGSRTDPFSHRFSDDFSIQNRSFAVIVLATFFDRFVVCFSIRFRQVCRSTLVS